MTLTQTHKTALERFAETLDVKQVRRASKVRFQLPLLFDDFEQEVNFWALNSLLSFGSGWHQARAAVLGAKTGVPHRDSVLHMLMGLHMEGNKLDATSLSELSAFAVSQVTGAMQARARARILSLSVFLDVRVKTLPSHVCMCVCVCVCV